MSLDQNETTVRELLATIRVARLKRSELQRRFVKPGLPTGERATLDHQLTALDFDIEDAETNLNYEIGLFNLEVARAAVEAQVALTGHFLKEGSEPTLPTDGWVIGVANNHDM